jgi:hypothetical protein
MRAHKEIKVRVSQADYKRAKILADSSNLAMSEYFRMIIQINYSIKLASEGKKPQTIATEFGLQLNEDFIKDFVRQMSEAMADFDFNEAIKVDTTNPNTLLKQTFTKAQKVA